MATTPTPTHTAPPPPPKPNPTPQRSPSAKGDTANPLQDLATQQKQAEDKRRELLRKEEGEAADLSQAEKDTLATGERRARQGAGIEDAHYLESQADNERAQIEERVEEQAAAKRHPVTGEVVNVMGVPPRPDMAVTELLPPEALPENTRAEMDAGRAALQFRGVRSDQEHIAGRRTSARVPNSQE